MKKKLSVISLCVVVVMLVSLLSACGNSNKKFIGTWEEINSDGELLSDGTTLVLANDGTGSITSDGISGSVTWSVEKDKVFISISLCGMTEATECTYEFSGNTMTLVDEDGGETIYRKKQ